MNLMNNAVDAMAQGGELRIRTLGLGKEVVLEVQDTGPGMTREIRAKLFEPFFTTKSKEGGTGLGLAICQGLVQSHEGRIEVESEPGRGSLFRVAIPALQAVPFG